MDMRAFDPSISQPCKNKNQQIIPGWSRMYDLFNTCFDWPRDVFTWDWVNTVVKWSRNLYTGAYGGFWFLGSFGRTLLRENFWDLSSLRCNLVHSGCLNLANAWIPYWTCIMLKYLINHRCGIYDASRGQSNCCETKTSWQRWQHICQIPVCLIQFV